MRGLVVSPEAFNRQMAVMSALGYRGMSMSDLEPYLMGQRQGRVFGITFDDGYENNFRCALPVLRRFGFSSTCYVVADRIGQTNCWDAEQGVPQVPLMNLSQLQTWIDAGQEVGSHTLSHPNLAKLTRQQQMREISVSKTQLEALLIQVGGVRHFCYPYGGLNQEAVQCVESSGYITATTTVRGRVMPVDRPDMLLLPRVLVSRTTTWVQLLAKCMTRYEDRRGRMPLGGHRP